LELIYTANYYGHTSISAQIYQNTCIIDQCTISIFSQINYRKKTDFVKLTYMKLFYLFLF